MDTKLMNAVSMESLDHCSTISPPLETQGQVSAGGRARKFRFVRGIRLQVRTLFVSGLPLDCKQRELYLLFRACAGYENSLLKANCKTGKSAAPVGFVTFATKQDADDACRKLQGVRFDPESAQTIRLEPARSNTKVPKPKQASPPLIAPANLAMLPQQNAALAAAAAAAAAFMPTSGAQPTAADLHAAGALDHLSYIGGGDPALLSLSLAPYAQALQFLPNANAAAAAAAAAAGSPLIPTSSVAAIVAHLQQQQHQHHSQQLSSLFNPAAAAVTTLNAAAAAQAATTLGNAPCSTLFVANLGASVNEDEVRQVNFRSA